MFCRRDGNSALEDMNRMLERLRKRVAGQTIRGGIMSPAWAGAISLAITQKS